MNILVIGRAKTGTTIIAKTLENSLEDCNFIMEPKSISDIETKYNPKNKHNVIKVIFEHWNKTPRLRNALINNEFSIKFDKVVFIARDPRDEMISRMMYFVKPYFDKNGFDKTMYENWLSKIIYKQQNPKAYTFLQLIHDKNLLFGSNFLHLINATNVYFKFLNGNRKFGHVIKYEDFISGNIGELENYLSLTLNHTIKDQPVIRQTKRSSKFDNWREFFTATDVEIFKKLLKPNPFYKLIDWELTNSELMPENYQHYITNLVNKSYLQ